MGLAEAQTLPIDLGVLLLCLFFLLLLSEQVLSESTVKGPLVSSAKLEAIVFVTIVSLDCLTLEFVASALVIPLIFLLPFYFPSNSCLS